MKNVIFLIVVFVYVNSCVGQNPVSYPKDTALSAPELNFEVLWHTFEDNYAFFKLRNVNWKKTYQFYRPKVNATTSKDSLYAIFCSMLAPFQDNHINVIIPNTRQFKSIKPSQFTAEFSTDSLREIFQQMVDSTLYTQGFAKLKAIGKVHSGKPLFSYTISKDYGYLRFNRCFVDGDADNKPDALVAGKLLDTVFSNFGHVKALIVDVRDNIGGNDEFAFEVARRFTSKRMVGMYKQTRITGGGYEQFGKLDTWMLEPKGGLPFLKPVIVLTNDKTVSAGDVFAMLMKELPQVRLAGTNTRGIYSDMYGFTLPNGWLLSLSNQRYYNNKMVCYEGSGTPVDLRAINTRKDLIEMADPVLLLALKQLNK